MIIDRKDAKNAKVFLDYHVFLRAVPGRMNVGRACASMPATLHFPVWHESERPLRLCGEKWLF